MKLKPKDWSCGHGHGVSAYPARFRRKLEDIVTLSLHRWRQGTRTQMCDENQKQLQGASACALKLLGQCSGCSGLGISVAGMDLLDVLGWFRVRAD